MDSSLILTFKYSLSIRFGIVIRFSCPTAVGIEKTHVKVIPTAVGIEKTHVKVFPTAVGKEKRL
ncbi:hypothetical protein [Sediminitomix flava]|uniref:Uncharacterized protein n=1 Tax=Sediminitomix flava TaxID=379075 RepID=A0A315Z9U8_SEDFL|nr:hypothetical protein [Sediminitomix flava]PWJ42110.1 hypothetical protein BC781_103360 [Sediminitomix flava]